MSDENSNAIVQVKLAQFATAFIWFSTLTTLALLWPERTDDLILGRIVATIWACTAMLIPAYIFYPFRSATDRMAALAHLFWSFAFVLCVMHVVWATAVNFASVKDLYDHMLSKGLFGFTTVTIFGWVTVAPAAHTSIFMVALNSLLLLWWAFDVYKLWTIPQDKVPSWYPRYQSLTRIAFFIGFLANLLLYGDQQRDFLGIPIVSSQILAIVLLAWGALAFVVGYWVRDPKPFDVVA